MHLFQGAHASFKLTILNVTGEYELPFAVTADTIQSTGLAEITLSQDIDFENRTIYRFLVRAIHSKDSSTHAVMSLHTGSCNRDNTRRQQ